MNPPNAKLISHQTMRRYFCFFAIACSSLLFPTRAFSQVEYNMQISDRLFPSVSSDTCHINNILSVLEDILDVPR